MKNAETNLQNKSLLAVGTRDDVMAWRQQSGTFRAMDNPERLVRVGVPGMSDAMLVVKVQITEDMIGKVFPVAVAAEFKTPDGKQSPKQALWQRAFEKVGGIYRLIRSPGELVKLIEDVKRGLW